MASLLLVVLAYFSTGWLGSQILTAGSLITLVWLPTGIAMAAMLRWGSGVWPAVYLGTFLVNLSMGCSWPLTAAIAVGNTLGPLITVGLLKRIGIRSPVDYFQRNPGLFNASIRSAPVLATVILLTVFGVASAQQGPGKPLVVGSEEDYPPFAIGKTDEAAGGFTVELWKVVAAENGLDYAIRVLPFGELLEEFKAGKIDVMINLAQSEERRVYADFSVPHVIVNGAVFVRKDESRIRSEADLVGKSIIVLNSDLANDYAISKAWKQQLVLVDTAADGLKLLASGQHDAMLLSKLAGMQTLLALKNHNIKALDAKAGFSQRFSFAVLKGHSELLAKINEGLALTKSSGAYDALYEKWFGVFEAKEVSFRQMLKYLAPITLVFLVFASILWVRQNERRKGLEALSRSHESLERRVAERTAELHQAESNQRTIVESLPQLVWTCDAEGNCDWLGKQWVYYTGLPAAVQLGYGWTAQVHPDDRAHATAIWHSAVSSGVIFDAEFRIRRHDGEYRWFKTRAAPLRDDAGRVIRWFGTNTDIHDQREQQVILEDRVNERTVALKQAQAAVIENERQLSNLFANLPGMTYSCNNDKDWTMTIVSEGCKAITGYERSELHQNHSVSYGDLIHPEDRDWLWSKCEASLDARTQCNNEYRIIAKAGDVRWVWERAEGVYAADGTLLRIEGFVQDITDRIQAEEARALLATIVDNAGDAIISRTLDGTITSWNAAAETVFGYSTNEAIGQPITRIIVPNGGEHELASHSRQLLDGLAIPSVEVVRRTKDGRLIHVMRSISPVKKNDTHEVIGAAIIMRDVSELKRSEAARTSLEVQLREAQKMEAIGTLAGGIAHDFNNIIATILGNAELAREDASANPAALESLEEIRKAGTRARDLVQQILAFSRRQQTERKLTTLALVIDESVRLLRASLPARISLEIDCDPEVPAIRADATLIQQALINLATNAMQAMQDQPGRIGIRLHTVMLDAALVEVHPALHEMHARHPGRTVRLAVSDDGQGMDAATLAKVFEPFFTTKPAGEGTGLGLSVVHGIVQSHNGAIVVQSQPGERSTFALYLPLASVSSGAPRPDDRVATPTRALTLGGGQHILYLDDDESLVHLVKRLLERRGYRVSSYLTQSEALTALRADSAAFDLVVTDYNMPGMSGLDVAREVRAIRADLPVAVTSGFIDETLRIQAKGAGVRELIFKADSVEVYCATIQRLAETVEEKMKSS